MIQAKPSLRGRFFWRNWSKWGTRLRFQQMRIVGETVADPQRSILMVGNHISWWDGFWPIELNRRIWKKQYHVMMLEDQLKLRMFMREGGAFSIQPNSRDMLNSLKYAAELLNDARNLVLMYPQGKIHSLYESQIDFSPGVKKILKWTEKPVQVMMFVMLIDFGSFARPTLTYYLEEWQPGKGELGQAYQAFYATCLARQKKDLLSGKISPEEAASE
ncbi:MAG: 1-acyl-sn-glycerol-3-phosphate acyltransferase [Bacteroidota bacterium]